MPQIGPLEILVIAVIGLLVFGPEKLPEIARTIGRTVNHLRQMADEMRDEFQTGLDIEDDRPAGASRRRTAANSPHPMAAVSGATDDETTPPGEPAAEETGGPGETGAEPEDARTERERTTPKNTGVPEQPLPSPPPTAAGMRWQLADDDEVISIESNGDREAPAGSATPPSPGGKSHSD